MDIPEHDDSVPAGLVSLDQMVRRTADHRYGPGWMGTFKVEDTLHLPGGRFNVTIEEPSFRRREEVEELIRVAAENGALLIHFADGQRPPLWYWRSDPGLASIQRGYFVARYSGILPDYDDKPLFAGQMNFARWLAAVPKDEATASASSPEAVFQGRRAPKRELVAEALEALYGERNKWRKASKQILAQVNNWLTAQGLSPVSIFTLRRTIRRK